MIKVRGNKVTFTGKDAVILNKEAKRLDMSPQHLFTGILWEYVLHLKRKEADEKSYKAESGSPAL